MPFEPGAALGSYEILASVGSTPGAAYTASDTQLNRVVVLKILPPQFVERPELIDRLKREIQTIASLNHPHISVPYAVEAVTDHDPPLTTPFLVTERVEGESLAERLARGPLPIGEALKVAIAIADALDKAHRQGVVHRGLTPSTVMLTPAGPKILDFGVATPSESVTAAMSATVAMTRTSLSTMLSVPLAAASYMAPEQFEGIPADARTDIFAVGAILYEMVTGRKAFDGRTQPLVIAAVQSVDPDPVSQSQPMAPPALDHVVKRCLSKDPGQRLQTAWDLLVQLRWIAEGGSGVAVAAPVAAPRRTRDRLVWAALAGAALVVTALSVPPALSYFAAAPEPEMVRFVVTNVGQGAPIPVSISPNGRWIIGSKGGAVSRGVDAVLLNSVTSQVLIADSVVYQPFWSPDSRFIGFFEDGKLKKADVSGGPPQTICETPASIGHGTWNRDGVVLFSAAGVIQRVLAAGGQPTVITELDQSRQETEHLAPYFLPDGRQYVFLALSSQQGGSAIYAGSLDSKERRRLFPSDSRAMYAAPGYLLFNRGNTVFAQPFDARTLALTGEAIRVADGVPVMAVGPNSTASNTRFANFSVSQTGVLIYRTGANLASNPTSTDEQRSLVWIDRNGTRVGEVGPPAAYIGLDLSPDGKRFAVHRHEGAGGDSWVFDMAQGRMQRLTFDAGQDNQSPVWSPDGTRVAFASRRNNKWGVYVKLVDGAAMEELITESDAMKAPQSWSPDGKLLVYFQGGGSADVWAVPVTGDRKPFPVLESRFNELFPQVSPDGKWMAYQSNETGRPEIYVKQFPEGPGKSQVSTDGGQFPRWRRDGKELYFVVPPNVMSVGLQAVGSTIQAGIPQTLFGLGGNPSAVLTHSAYHRYAVSADGQRFLISQPGTVGPLAAGGLAENLASIADRGGNVVGSTSTAPNAVTVVLNWPQALKQK